MSLASAQRLAPFYRSCIADAPLHRYHDTAGTCNYVLLSRGKLSG